MGLKIRRTFIGAYGFKSHPGHHVCGEILTYRILRKAAAITSFAK